MPLLRQGGSLQVMPGEDQASSTGKGEKNGVMGDNGGSLEEWARRFCADDAESKRYLLRCTWCIVFSPQHADVSGRASVSC